MTEEYREELEDDQSLRREDLAEAIAKTRREWKNAASERAIRHYKEVYAVEMDFARREEYLKMAGNKMSLKEFERWEDTVAEELRLAKDEILRGKLGTKSEAEAMQHMITYCDKSELSKTIEAQAGRYYAERDNDLRLAIRGSGDADVEEDLAYRNGFHQVALMQLEASDSLSKVVDVKYEYSTQLDYHAKLYNTTICYLNGLNRLAQKYETRAFVPRDLWTSDLCDRQNYTPAIVSIIRYDRGIVEEYCLTMFKTHS